MVLEQVSRIPLDVEWKKNLVAAKQVSQIPLNMGWESAAIF